MFSPVPVLASRHQEYCPQGRITIGRPGLRAHDTSHFPPASHHRYPRKPSRPVAGRTCQGPAGAAGPHRHPAGHDHARRPDPGPHAEQGRRQGPVRQGAGAGAGRRSRRPGRAFAQGCADGAAARFRTGLRDGARGSARCLCLAAVRQSGCGAAGRRAGHLQPASHRAAACAAAGSAHRTAARQPRYPLAQAGRGPV